MNQLDQQFTLRDGRRLGWAEYGNPQGRPVLYFHGWPASRLEPRLMDADCAELGVRLVAPDRPGMGLSDFKPRRSIVDWAADVAELAGHLDLNRFAVLGVSGGGPYAAACAAALPGRLSAVLLVCSVGPVDFPGATQRMVGPTRWLLRFARGAPWLARILAGPCLRALWGHGEQVMPHAIEARLPQPDRLALARPEIQQTLVASSREGFRPGLRGPAWDGLLFGQPWGFRFEAIRTPVWLWHGELDVIVPPAMGRHLAASIPHCRATFYPADGHFSLPFNRVRQILGALND
jgi:pimeloyl-ACP methyl ester carboxylesterase